MEANAVQRKPGTTEFVALIALMTSMTALSIDAMLPALPRIGEDLGTASPNATQFVLTSLMIGIALGQLVFGPISDSTGRRPPVFAGLILFAVGCVVSAFARDLPTMLAGRFLQGFGVAGPRSVSMALIRDLHHGREMAKILSTIMSVFILVPIVAPLYGQTVLLVADWRTIFLSFLSIAVVVTVWFGLRQPETLPRSARRPFSAASLGASVLEVLRQRAAMGFTVTAGLSSGAFIGYLSTSQQIFQDQYGQGERFPLLFGVLAISIGVAAQLNGRLVLRLGMMRLTSIALRSLAGLSIGFLAWVVGLGANPPFWAFMLFMLLALFCVGVVFGNINSLAMDPLGHVAGVGAALVASISLVVAVGLGGLIGQLLDTTVLPLVGGFAVLSPAALAMLHLSDRWREDALVQEPVGRVVPEAE